MNVTDDPTRFDVDLSNCDREPIHLLGRIQDFGVLVAVSSDWLVRYASTNIDTLLDRSAADLLGEPLDTHLPRETIHALRGRLQLLANEESTERLFGFDVRGDGTLFDIGLHRVGETIVIEFEEHERVEATAPGALVKTMLGRVQSARNLEAVFHESVRQLRAVTRFDRVMLYRFQDDGAGSVVAETMRAGLESFLGLNYPATDIPRQARALYVRNLIRTIADVNATPVPVEPPLSPEGEALDLSLSLTRAVSSIHVEYLHNMGVQASLSVSIVIDGKLWGLFALHHYEARRLSMEMRSALELFGQMVSLIIEGRLDKERREAEDAARLMHDRFINKIAHSTATIAEIADHADDLRRFIACDGFAVWTDGKARCFGQCPPPEEIASLAKFLNRAAAGRIYATDELGAIHPPARDYTEIAAGVLAIPVSRTPRDYLMFFRKEIVQTVNWAGDPTTKEVAYGPNGPRLTPRKSFELWKETVRGKALGWTESDRRIAESLRVSLLEVLVRFNEEREREQSQATQRQELLIAELNHRVRNILSLIRALVAQSRAGVSSVDEFAAIIGGRIQALARAHDQITQDEFAAQAIGEILRTEVAAYLGHKSDRIHLEGPPVLVKSNAFSVLALVFHEMVTNSAKYGGLSDSAGRVEVKWQIDAHDRCVIRWAEFGGPTVKEPSRRGFGTTIIERSIPYDLGGEAKVDYDPSGLRARFVLPATAFKMAETVATTDGGMAAVTSEPVPLQPDDPADESRLNGLTALIVEDNMIIALDTETLLYGEGMKAVHTASSLHEARRIIAETPIDVALLDVNLGGEESFPLAADLDERGTPYVFATGYGEAPSSVAAFSRARLVKKPFDAEQLTSALSKALADAADAE